MAPRRPRSDSASGVSCALAVALLVMVGCEKKTPDSPGVTPGPVETVNGSERIGWSQTAADRIEIATFRYAIYIDDVRTELAGATCVAPPSRSSAAFACSAPLPALPAGAHTIELATFIVDGTVFESGRSTPLRVNKTSAASAAPGLVPPAEWASGLTVATADGVRVRIDRLAGGLVRPSDIAFLPDGRLLVAEESGRVVVMTADGRVLAVPELSQARSRPGAVGLLSLAVDPSFDKTHAVYVVYTTLSQDVSRVFTLSRFTEAANALFGEVVLLDGIPASRTSAASVRVGADGKLFVAFDDGGDFRRAGDLASPSGKVLRLNPDGTTPADQAGLTPAYATDIHSPHGFDWQPGSRVLWLTDRVSGTAASLIALASQSGPQRRGVRLASYALPRGTRPSSAVFLRGPSLPGFQNDLLIASEEGRHLLRVRFDAASQTRVVATERLLQDVVGGVRVVAVAPDGGVYFATDDAVALITAAE